MTAKTKSDGPEITVQTNELKSLFKALFTEYQIVLEENQRLRHLLERVTKDQPGITLDSLPVLQTKAAFATVINSDDQPDRKLRSAIRNSPLWIGDIIGKGVSHRVEWGILSHRNPHLSSLFQVRSSLNSWMR